MTRLDKDYEENKEVQHEVEILKDVAKEYTSQDLKDGSWFGKFLFHVLRTYMEKINWDFFKTKYPNLPADAIVDRRIHLAQRYAMIEAGLTASAYSTAIAATIGTAGGASPLTIPGAITCFTVDLLYVTKLQLQLAYDLAILYNHPINRDDPEDMYDLLRVAFGIKAGEAIRETLPKAIPEATRVAVKKIFTGSALAWLKALPIIGKYLLQRNIIKFAIPMIGIPISMKMNHWQTGQVGKKARGIYRDKAKIRELAHNMACEHELPSSVILKTAWYIVYADQVVRPEEGWFLKTLTDELDEDPNNAEVLHDFREMIAFDKEGYLRDINNLPQSLRELVFEIATSIAVIDHEINEKEIEALKELSLSCQMHFNESTLKKKVK